MSLPYLTTEGLRCKILAISLHLCVSAVLMTTEDIHQN